MNLPSLSSGPRWRRALTASLLLVASALAWAQADPPTRVAYVSALEGSARISTDAYSSRPSMPGEAARIFCASINAR